MPESNKPFVITDRRKFTMEGDLRPEAAHPEEQGSAEAKAEQQPGKTPAPPPVPDPLPAASAEEAALDGALDAPTQEQTDQSRFAYEQTADRIDTAIRAANPGADHPPAMNFDQLVQSIYLTAMMQLGGGTPEGQKPQVDILGARSSIDMLAVLKEKTAGNLSTDEGKLLDSALFELRMVFLEITQAIARSAATRSGAPAKPGLVV